MALKRKAYDIWDKKVEAKNEWIPSSPQRKKRKAHPKLRGAAPDPGSILGPGASYNPSLAAHRALMRQAADVELQKEDRQAKIARSLKGMLRVSKAEADALVEFEDHEMERGLFSDDEEEQQQRQRQRQTEAEAVPVAASNLQRRKTKAEKKRQAANAAQEKAVAARRRDKAVTHQLNNIPKLRREVETQLQEQQKKKSAKEAAPAKKRSRIGRFRLEEEDVVVPLPEDLPGSMRLAKADGNPLEDFYKSLQRRGIVEPRDRRSIRHRSIVRRRFEKK